MKGPAKRLGALVLAGSRAGGDPLAAQAGVSHKALIEVGGRAMIERVVEALGGVVKIERIVIAIEQPELLVGLPGLQPARCTKPLAMMDADRAGPSATTAAALAREGVPLLVTTADNALLQTRWVEEFLAACPPDADLVVALARRESVLAAAPDAERTWLRFSDGQFSGCNLFLLARPAAAASVAFWREIEGERKNPLRLMQRLGWDLALRYRLGRLSLAAAAARLGELSGGAKIGFIVLRDGRAAVDVDKPTDLELVRRLVQTHPIDANP